MRCGAGKPRANPVTQVTTTGTNGTHTTDEGREAAEKACMESTAKRYNQGNNSPFLTDQMLEDLGWVGDGPKMDNVLEGRYDFPEDCTQEARAICKQARVLHQEVVNDAPNVWWWRSAKEDTQSSMSAVHFGHLMIAATNDYLTALYVQKLNSALATGKPLSRWGRSLVVLLEKVFGSIMFEKLRAIILFEADFNCIHKVLYNNHKKKMIKKHRLMPEEQCAQSEKHGNEGSMLKLLHCNVSSPMHVPHTAVSADLENAFDSA